MLTIKHLSVEYDGMRVVRDFSMQVKQGELVSLVGANGAGKSTILKTISGIKHPAEGECEFDGMNISQIDASHIVELGLIHVPEGRRLFPAMTVFENLELGAFNKTARKKKQKNLEYVFSMFPDLKTKQNERAGSLSGGQQQMVAIARGLMANPKLLILDEPSIGLSPLMTKTMFEVIRKIKQEGVTVLLVEQNVQVALSCADRGYVLEEGRLCMEGIASDLLQNDRMRKAYLGM